MHFRIFPAYWAILLLTAFVLQSARIYHAHFAIGAMHSPSLLLQNAVLLQNYRPKTIATGIVPAWSLTVELAFYLLLPVLVIAATKLAGEATTHRQRVIAMLSPAVFMATLGVASSVFGSFTGPTYAQSWTSVWRLSMPPHAQLFAPGLALAVARVEYQDGRLRLPPWWRLAAALSLIALVATATTLSASETISFRADVGLIAIACGLLLALVVLPPPHLRSRLVSVLDSPIPIGIGLISYSVFLRRYTVMLWLRGHDLTHGGGFKGFAFNFVLAAVITGALSWVTYRFVERPALRLKARSRTSKGEPTPTGTASTAPTAPGPS